MRIVVKNILNIILKFCNSIECIIRIINITIKCENYDLKATVQKAKYFATPTPNIQQLYF